LVEKELFEKIGKMSQRERATLLKVLEVEGKVTLKVKNGRVVSGRFIKESEL